MLLACSAQVIAQEVASADTMFLNDAATHAKKTHKQSKSIQSHLYNGVAYIEPPTSSVDQFPQYISNEWSNGSVQYDGESFDDVGILYDIYTDDVIVEMPSTGASVKLIKEKVSSFSMLDLRFIKLSKAPTAGFYGVLYDGNTKVYARFEKKKQERIESNAVSIDYESKTRYYIFKDGIFHTIGSQGDIYKVLSTKKNELKQFARKEKMKFRKNKQQSIVKLVTFYDTIQP